DGRAAGRAHRGDRPRRRRHRPARRRSSARGRSGHRDDGACGPLEHRAAVQGGQVLTQSSRRDFRPVTKPVGAVVIGIGFATLLCALIGGIWDGIDPLEVEHPGGVDALVGAAFAMIVPGAILYRYGHGHQKKTLSRREAVLAVAIIWLAVGVFGAFPFAFGAGLTPADAFFESVSGFTTTRSTVITDIASRHSRSMHLFRSLTQSLGRPCFV